MKKTTFDSSKKKNLFSIPTSCWTWTRPQPRYRPSRKSRNTIRFWTTSWSDSDPSKSLPTKARNIIRWKRKHWSSTVWLLRTSQQRLWRQQKLCRPTEYRISRSTICWATLRRRFRRRRSFYRLCRRRRRRLHRLKCRQSLRSRRHREFEDLMNSTWYKF